MYYGALSPAQTCILKAWFSLCDCWLVFIVDLTGNVDKFLKELQISYIAWIPDS